jgi:hypothetical protein
MVETLAPGSYTAVMQGVNNGTGTGLIELYDLEQSAASYLANISTRGFVGTSDAVMIGGFIVGGSGGGRAYAIARAIGPTLIDKGVPDWMYDPILDLRDQNGALVASNDSWADEQWADAMAAHLAPGNPRECAIAAELAPGSYTTVVRGKDRTVGVALVEIYNVR